MRGPSFAAVILFFTAMLWQWALTIRSPSRLFNDLLDQLRRADRLLFPESHWRKEQLLQWQKQAWPAQQSGQEVVRDDIVVAEVDMAASPLYAARWQGHTLALETALEAGEWEEAYDAWIALGAEELHRQERRSGPGRPQQQQARSSVVAAQLLAKLQEGLQGDEDEAARALTAASTFAMQAQASEFIREAMARQPRLAEAGEAALWRLWKRSGSREHDAILASSIIQMQGEEFADALNSLDALVGERDEFAEAWNQRATLHYLERRYEASLDDVAATLARNPNHFGALSGSALVHMALWRATPGPAREGIEHLEAARGAFARVVELYPHSDSAKFNLGQVEKLYENLDDERGRSGGAGRAGGSSRPSRV